MAPSDENGVPADAVYGVPDEYARGALPSAARSAAVIEKDMRALPIGRANPPQRQKLALISKKVAISHYGSMLKPAMEVAEELDAKSPTCVSSSLLTMHSSRNSRGTTICW